MPTTTTQTPTQQHELHEWDAEEVFRTCYQQQFQQDPDETLLTQFRYVLQRVGDDACT